MLALDSKISSWCGFDRALRKPDREDFEELMGMCCKNVWAVGYVCNSIIFEPGNMSVIFGQQKKIGEFEVVSAMSMAGES